jgi:hypothetical protein
MPRWPETGHIALALDIHEAVLPKLGLEYYLDETARHDPAARLRCLEDAAAKGWLGPRWPKLLAGIHSMFRRKDCPDFWPESLDAISGLTGQEALVLLHYGHIKLVHDGRGFKDSKAYVYSTYGFAR